MKYHRPLRCFVLAAFAVTAALPAATHAQTTIVLRPQQSRGPISPFIYGTNQRYNNNASGTWDAAQKKMVPAFDRNHREAGLKSMRYPGGTVASTFEWKHAIGPLEKRRKIQPAQGLKATGGGGGPQIATWGVDEAARWCETNKVELVYMYGIGAPNSNPADAADLVEYLNAPVGKNPNGGTDWAKVRAENGHPAPYHIRFFEIANEADGPSQRYWWPFIDSDETRAKAKLPFQPQRDSYAPEYCFGGMARFEKQPVGIRDEGGGRDFRDEMAQGYGSPGQNKTLRYVPIEPNSDTVFVGGEAWQRVKDATTRGKVYQMEPQTGTITFSGDAPPSGGEITASYRARRWGFVDYYKAMKAVDTNLTIYAGYESLNVIKTLGDKYPYDGVVIHPYTNQYNIPKAATWEEWHNNLMLSSARLGDEVREYQHAIDTTVAPDRKGKVRMICTEFGAISQNMVMPPDAGGRDSYAFLNVGLYTGLQIMEFMETGVPQAHRHATTVGVFGPAPDFAMTPTARVYELFTHHFGDRLIGVQVSDNPERITNKVMGGKGVGRRVVLPNAPNAPANAPVLSFSKLKAEASRDANGNVYVVVINQDAGDDVAASIQVAGGASGEAEVWTLNGPTFHAVNTPQNPNAVALSSQKAQNVGGTLRYVFPAHSLTTITFPKGKTK